MLSRPRISRAGCRRVRQIEFALFDMLLHHDFDPEGERSLAAVARRRQAARRGRSFRRNSTVFRTASRTSSPAATRPVTTATNGRRCCPPTPTACSRRTACSIAETGARFRAKFCGAAEAARRWTPSSPFAAARPRSTPCCATAAWRIMALCGRMAFMRWDASPRNPVAFWVMPETESTMRILAVVIAAATATAAGGLYNWADPSTGNRRLERHPPPRRE